MNNPYGSGWGDDPRLLLAFLALFLLVCAIA